MSGVPGPPSSDSENEVVRSDLEDIQAASVEIDDLTFTYADDTPVLNQLSLSVEAGERVAILGPNGSGKTTLALHLNGLLPTQRGSVRIDDEVVGEPNLRQIRRDVGMVFQDPDDQLFMQSVRDDVAFGPANLGVGTDELDAVARRALQDVGASELIDRSPHHLSGGEKRRAAIATVLSMDPRVLVLDEPNSGLDPVGIRELSELLVSLGQTQIVVTHDLPFALATCPRSVIVSEGDVVADGSTWELLADSELLERHRLALPYGFVLVDQEQL